MSSPFEFEPLRHENELVPMVEEIRAEPNLDTETLQRIVRKYPKKGYGSFSKSEIIRAYRFFSTRFGWNDREDRFVERVRMKPIRTSSGVAPVTVLTKPFPCPGKCVFCPSDVRMPKSYLSREPGAQRAAQHEFDPFAQTLGRLIALHHTGHRVDKVEMIILGGTWSFYPHEYQRWFIKRCFDALNQFSPRIDELLETPEGAAIRQSLEPAEDSFSYLDLDHEVDGRTLDRSYNSIVGSFLREQFDGQLLDSIESATWEELAAVQLENETAHARSVGLVVETRPDHISNEEVHRIRRLGCTKIQIGIQSLDDRVLAANKRGHDVEQTRRAVSLIRAAGFKIHAHWMPNLLEATVEDDAVDFPRLFDDPAIRPDELKIYPCSLIETAELMQEFESGRWHPYSTDELVKLVAGCLERVPQWCRVTRIIRDIPGDDIHAGNKTTNLRQIVDQHLEATGRQSVDIRAREVRTRSIDAESLELQSLVYRTTVGEEVFFQLVTADQTLAGFCRLSLPEHAVFVEEISSSAMIRELHVYGLVVGIGSRPEGGRSRSQHLGFGKRLMQAAADRARQAGFRDLAVISSIGTKEYYRKLGFEDGDLYQHFSLG